MAGAPRSRRMSQHMRIENGMSRRLLLVSPRGLSLIEIMIALVVIVVGLSALRHVFPDNLATERHAVERMQATLLGKSQLEHLRLRGFTALAEAHFATTPEPFLDRQQQVVTGPFRWQAEVHQEAEGLLAVHVRVVWPWPAQTHQVRLATYVNRH